MVPMALLFFPSLNSLSYPSSFSVLCWPFWRPNFDSCGGLPSVISEPRTLPFLLFLLCEFPCSVSGLSLLSLSPVDVRSRSGSPWHGFFSFERIPQRPHFFQKPPIAAYHLQPCHEVCPPSSIILSTVCPALPLTLGFYQLFLRSSKLSCPGPITTLACFKDERYLSPTPFRDHMAPLFSCFGD